MKCKAGDMAVVLSAFHKANVGRFVSVVKLYDNTGDAAMGWEQPVWLVESHAPMTWTKGAKVWQGHQGPVPDSALQPIRGWPTPPFAVKPSGRPEVASEPIPRREM